MTGYDETAPLGKGLAGLDRLFEHRTRLAIAVLLTQEKEISFARLKDILDESDGNLGAQLRKLEDDGVITVEKHFVGRKPQSLYSLTASGRRRLEAHLDALDTLIAAGRKG